MYFTTCLKDSIFCFGDNAPRCSTSSVKFVVQLINVLFSFRRSTYLIKKFTSTYRHIYLDNSKRWISSFCEIKTRCYQRLEYGTNLTCRKNVYFTLWIEGTPIPRIRGHSWGIDTWAGGNRPWEGRVRVLSGSAFDSTG